MYRYIYANTPKYAIKAIANNKRKKKMKKREKAQNARTVTITMANKLQNMCACVSVCGKSSRRLTHTHMRENRNEAMKPFWHARAASESYSSLCLFASHWQWDRFICFGDTIINKPVDIDRPRDVLDQTKENASKKYECEAKKTQQQQQKWHTHARVKKINES